MMRQVRWLLFFLLMCGSLLSLPGATALAVNDTTPPVVQSASLSATTVAAGNSLTVTLHITDDLSGLAAQPGVYIQFDLSGGTQSIYVSNFIRVSGTPQDGMYQAIVNVPAAYPSGTYAVSYISAGDQASNRVSYNSCCVPQIPAAANVSFTVTDGSGTVAPTPTTTALTADHNPAIVGRPVTFTATVAVPSPGTGTPAAGTTVTFKDNGTTLGTGTLDATGTATFSTAALALGTHPITATFAGDAAFASSTSDPLAEQIAAPPAPPPGRTPPTATALAVAGYPSSTLVGVGHTFTVTATDSGGRTVAGYTGSVVFTSSDPAATLPATATLSGGTGTFTATLNTAGTQSITATDAAKGTITGTQGGIAVHALPVIVPVVPAPPVVPVVPIAPVVPVPPVAPVVPIVPITVPPAGASAIIVAAGNNQRATVGSAYATNLQAKVTDAKGNAVGGVAVTFTATSLGAEAAFKGQRTATATTDAQGIATAPTLTAVGTAGTVRVVASTAGVATTATFTLTNEGSGQDCGTAAQPRPFCGGPTHPGADPFLKP